MSFYANFNKKSVKQIIQFSLKKLPTKKKLLPKTRSLLENTHVVYILNKISTDFILNIPDLITLKCLFQVEYRMYIYIS